MEVHTDSQEYKNFVKSGKIGAKARLKGKSMMKVGASLLEVTEAVENYITDHADGCAFPPQISMNETAAHYCAWPDDDYIFQEGDLLKLDCGAHIDGAMSDNATSVFLGPKDDHKATLVKASEAALGAAVKALRPGVSPGEIGAAIQEAIDKFEGCVPVRNLCGHGLGIYNIHTSPSMPNYDTGSRKPEIMNQVVAIEPFVTSGVGLISERGNSSIFAINEAKPIRMPVTKKIFNHIKKTYSTLPFTTRWLCKDFPAFQVKTALHQLVAAGILTSYPPLVEKSNAPVAQSEFSVYIGEDKCHALTVPDDD